MGPVLALELSTEGIFLHELSYDGRWRQIAAAGLGDPALPKKMAAMRSAARASQGRLFKNEIWLPKSQVILRQMALKSDDQQRLQMEALQVAAQDPDIPAGEYIARIGEIGKDGKHHVALLDKNILSEAVRFATGYGFGADGITVPDKTAGFYDKPYFDSPTIAKPVSVNFRRFGMAAAASVVLGGIGYGGWYLYDSIEFSPNPATVIEATEERVFNDAEDPRAPIRPTAITAVAVADTPELTSTDTVNVTVQNVDSQIDHLGAFVGTTSLSSDLTALPAPTAATPLDEITFWQEAPLQPNEARPDSLPAPESRGFETTAPELVAVADATLVPNLTLALADAEYISKRPVSDLTVAASLPDSLPREESTVVLAALERKFNDGFGLSQVRENDAETLRMARIADFQNAPTEVQTGLPDITPTLRSGADITDIIDTPVVVASVETPQPMSTFELQRLAPIIEPGRPPFDPVLRGGVEIGAEPVVVAAAEPDTVLTPEELQNLAADVIEGQPDVVPPLREADSTETAEVADVAEPDPVEPLSTEELQNLAANVEDGPPDVIPTLREGVEIGAAPPAPPLTIAQLQALEPEIIEGAPAITPALRTVEDIADDTVVVASADPIDPLSIQELQNLSPDVIIGQPDIAPTLREGEAIAVPASTDALPELSLEELQNLAADVQVGQPEIIPPLREPDVPDAPDEPTSPADENTETAAETPEAEPAEPAGDLTLEDLQNLAAVVETGRPSVLPTLRSGEDVDTVVLTPEQEAAQIAALQAEDPLVLEGRPPVVPILRESIDLGEGSGIVAPDLVSPDQTDAARFRPVFRPDSIEDIAKVNDPDLSEAVVVAANAPPRRPADFASKVENMIENFAQVPDAQPRFDDAPREVSLPTSASVAATATIENALNLRATNLIGVFGQPGSYHAMIRQPGGRYLKVSIGDSIGDGWRVVGIDESSIRVQKGSRTETLGLPG